MAQVTSEAAMDAESAAWVRELQEPGAVREAAMTRLHAFLLRVARHEIARRGPHAHITGPELDDLAVQVASDAALAIGRKVAEFRGESRFTTWAYSFVIFGVANQIANHWSRRRPAVALDEEGWARLPARFGFDPAEAAESRELLAAVRHAVEHVLTPHQRRVFVAIVVRGMPLDALAAELGSNRNAIYKTMFDARRKLRASLVADHYLCAKMGVER